MSTPGNVGFPHLLSPFSIRNATMKNRLVFQPHFTALGGTDGLPTDDLKAYYIERAVGGAGLLVDGGMAVMAEGMMSRRFIRAYDERILPKYKEITDGVHANGAKIFSQLTHGGHTSLESPPPTMWAPTQMPEPSSQHSTRAMDKTDIRRTIEAFAASARNVMSAGFDGIEVKIAHDGLLRSFVSPFFNRRTDEYGGSFENRMRLSLEVIEAIRIAIGGEFPIGVRLCLDEYTDFGYGLDYGLRVAERLEATGMVDYFNSDAGSFSSFWMEIPPAAVEQGFFRPLNQELKKVSDLPVVAFGRIKQPHAAERMLELGEADLIGMARQLIADPFTMQKIMDGRLDEIRACIGCNDGCIARVVQEKGIRCVHNPGAGQEITLSERLFMPTVRSKNVVIVGGGPAGMKVAEVAAKRGHKVTLLERDSVLGGQVRLAARQPLHEEFAEVTAYLEAAISKADVDVFLNVNATADQLLTMEPDVLVIATGSEPNLPRSNASADVLSDTAVSRASGLLAEIPVPGLDLPHVFSTDEVLSGFELPGTRVLVIDASGHWEGVGTAEHLADRGFEVEVITTRSIPGFGLEATNLAMFLQRAKAKRIKLSPFTDVIGVDAQGAEVVDVLTGDNRRLDVDFVVPVYPRRSRNDLYLELEQLLDSRSDVQLVRVGDSSSPRLIEGMMVEAQKIGMEL
jgi:2,4-dienoyl-CoA reductase-like NADH-dependent reductase (Old Yellow Enzyme family)